MTNTFRMTNKVKDMYFVRACKPHCPYENKFCDNVQECPEFNKLIVRLGMYEDIMDINELRRMMNKKTLKNLPAKPEINGVWLYRDHLGGGLYDSEDQIDSEMLYCEECGDTDLEIGYFTSLPEAYEACAYDEEDIGTFFALMHIFYPSVTLYDSDFETAFEFIDTEEDIPPSIDMEMVRDTLQRLKKENTED